MTLPAGNVHVLSDLPGWDPDLGDPGRDWHDNADTLPDVSDKDHPRHFRHLDAFNLPDGAARDGGLLDAEFSAETPDGVV